MEAAETVKHTDRVGLKINAYTCRVLVGSRKKRNYLLELGIAGRIVLIREDVEWIILS
jgi:hypothetical protein